MSITEKRANVSFILVASVLFLISCLLHFYDIGTMPPGIHIDEAAVAYNAYCISETGADEHGVRMPVFFKSFSNYQDPVLIYTMVPLVKMFPLSKALARVPSAAYHILAATAFFFLSCRLIGSRWISLLMAFVFSLLPWIFPVSRTSIGGYTALLFGTTCGIYFLLVYISEKTCKYAIFAGISWAFAFYSHHPGRPMSVIILICFAIAFHKVLIKNIRHCLTFVLLLSILLMPMAISVLQLPNALTSRFNAISVWQDNPGLFEVILRIIHRYVGYFAPQFLFISGDSNYTHSTQYTGALYTFMAPFILIGAYSIIKRVRVERQLLFLSLITLTYPAAAMLTIGHRHGTACIGGSIYWVLLTGIGIKTVFDKINRFNGKAVFLSLVFIVVSLEMAFYFKDYFSAYRESSRGIYGANIYDSLEKGLKFRQKDEPVYISKFVFFPFKSNKEFKPEFYSVILFLTQLHPTIFREQGIPNNLVALYDYKQHQKGILIRLDSLVMSDENGQIKVVKDHEPIPEKMTLLAKIPTPSGICIEINRIGDD